MNNTPDTAAHGPAPEALERLLSQGRDGALLRMGLALAYHRRGELHAALEHVAKAQAFDPQFAAAGRLHGLIALALGDDAGAEAAFDRALKVAQERGEHQLARELAVRVRRLRPDATGCGIALTGVLAMVTARYSRYRAGNKKAP